MAAGARRILHEYDTKMTGSGDYSLISKANDAMCAMAKKETTSALNKITLAASEKMKSGYNRSDN